MSVRTARRSVLVGYAADRLFLNGSIHLMDKNMTVVEAIAEKDGRILAAGTNEQIMRLAGPKTRSVALDRKCVLPGFIDGHLHLLNYGLNLRRLALQDVRSITALKELVRAKAQTTPAGGWVIGRGWEQDVLLERRYPTRQDLDEAAPHHPVVITRVCGHVAVANSAALALAGLSESAQTVAGGLVDTDSDERPNGVLRERAMGLVLEHVPEPSRKELKEALRNAMRAVLSVGLTSVHTNDAADGPIDTVPSLYDELYKEGERLRVYWDVAFDQAESLLRTPNRTGSGNDLFKYGAIKLFVDGSLGARTAALESDYADQIGNRGVLVVSQEELDSAVSRCHRAGMQVAIHAIGDRAVRMSLDAIERAQNALTRPGARHRIVHCQIMTPELYPRFGELGVVAEIQPKFVATDLKWVEARVGLEKAATSYAWRTFLLHNVACSGGSDCPVEPPNPLYGIYAAVNRRDMNEEPEGGWMPEQRLSVTEAVRLFTLGGAYASGEEYLKGTLEPGKLCDFVALDQDIFEVDPLSIKDICVKMTCVGGQVV